MDGIYKGILTAAIRMIRDIQSGKSYAPLDVSLYFGEAAEMAQKINAFAKNIEELNVFLTDLANGKLNTNIPPRSNYLAAAAKQLHSNLNHLSWQTQQIAKGDYKQQVDFMGDFAVAFNRLISQLNEREKDLVARNEILQTIFDHVECLFVFSEKDRHKAFYINDFARRTFKLDDRFEFSPDEDNFVTQLFTLSLVPRNEHELYNSRSNQWFNVIMTELTWLNNEPAILFYCINITSHKERQLELERKAFFDPLTNLNNRRSLDLFLSDSVHAAIRLKTNVTVYIIDIDNFKRYNDTYGHLQGDACLVAAAKCIKSVFVRATDFVARFGGEEFVIVSLNMNAETALTFGEKLRAALEACTVPLFYDPDNYTSFTASIGVHSLIPTRDDTPASIIAKADTALYRSKTEGRNRITIAE